MKQIGVFILFTFTLFINAQTLSSDKIISFYSLDGNANDLSGNGRHCVENNVSLAVGVDGVANSCYDVTDGYLEYPDSFPIPDSTLTFSAWIKPSDYNISSIFRCGNGKFDITMDYSYNVLPDESLELYFYPQCTIPPVPRSL